jgi:hypothetical protein
MHVRTLIAGAGVALAVTALTVTAAGAGGWAVTTLDPVSAAPVPGESTPIGYTILQHGETPVSLDDTAIVVTPAQGGQPMRFAGRPNGAVGHHVAQVTFTAAGTFRWSVEQGWFGPQDLGTIEVAAAGVTPAGASNSGDGTPVALRAGLLAATVLCAGLFGAGLAIRRRRRPAVLAAG